MGTLPLVAFLALACLQAALLALSLVFAQTAADRAARDMPRAQVAASIPAVWRSTVRFRRSGGSVTVSLRAPRLLPAPSRMLRVDATATVQP